MSMGKEIMETNHRPGQNCCLLFQFHTTEDAKRTLKTIIYLYGGALAMNI